MLYIEDKAGRRIMRFNSCIGIEFDLDYLLSDALDVDLLRASIARARILNKHAVMFDYYQGGRGLWCNWPKEMSAGEFERRVAEAGYGVGELTAKQVLERIAAGSCESPAIPPPNVPPSILALPIVETDDEDEAFEQIIGTHEVAIVFTLDGLGTQKPRVTVGGTVPRHLIRRCLAYCEAELTTFTLDEDVDRTRERLVSAAKRSRPLRSRKTGE